MTRALIYLYTYVVPGPLLVRENGRLGDSEKCTIKNLHYWIYTIKV